MGLYLPSCLSPYLMTSVSNTLFLKHILTRWMDQYKFAFRKWLLVLLIPQSKDRVNTKYLGQILLRWMSCSITHMLTDSWHSGITNRQYKLRSFFMIVLQVRKQIWKQILVFFLLNWCFPLCLFWGKELTFTGLAIKSDVQPVCHRLYTKVSTHYCLGFFCIYVFMSTLSTSIHVHTHLTLKNSECYKIKYSKMSKYHKWRFLCNHEFNKKTPHRLAEDGRWK